MVYFPSARFFLSRRTDSTRMTGNILPDSIPAFRSSFARCVTKPTIPGPTEPPRSPAMARSANIAVPPSGILETLRKNPPAKIGGYQVTSARDYKLDTVRNMATGEITETGLPKSNVLYYDLTDDAWLCVRPSGTEPKVKFYYGVKGTSLADADEKSKALATSCSVKNLCRS